MTQRAIIKALVAGSLTTLATATLSVHAGLPLPVGNAADTCGTSRPDSARKPIVAPVRQPAGTAAPPAGRR